MYSSNRLVSLSLVLNRFVVPELCTLLYHKVVEFVAVLLTVFTLADKIFLLDQATQSGWETLRLDKVKSSLLFQKCCTANKVHFNFSGLFLYTKNQYYPQRISQHIAPLK
jgi:hypothetical protein